MCSKEDLIGRDSKVHYDAISRADSSTAAEGSCNGAQPRILQTGTSCTCCITHAISTSNLALAGKHETAQRLGCRRMSKAVS